MSNDDHELGFKLDRTKDRNLILDYIRRRVESGLSIPCSEMQDNYSQEQLFYESLKHVTTTKKALCEALDLPVEGCCRYKRTLQRAEKLWEVKKIYCPLTRRRASILTTDPSKAPKRDDGPQSIQLSLF